MDDNKRYVKGIIKEDSLTDTIQPSSYNYKTAILLKSSSKMVRTKNENTKKIITEKKPIIDNIKLIFSKDFLDNNFVPFNENVIVYGNYLPNVFCLIVDEIIFDN